MISQHRLERLFSSLAGSAQRGTFFRSIDLHWLLQGTPLSAIGSRIPGGRYNRKGAFEAFYIANTQVTALYETEAIFKIADVVVGVRQPPRVMLSLEYNLHDIVDLREPTALAALGITIDDLKQPWKLAQAEDRPVLTQRIGAAARAVDVEALLVPSARAETGTNLVVFPDRLLKGSSVDLYVGDEPTMPRYTLNGQYDSKIRIAR
ncbi:MAG: RES family NAD+ phosphorylase [Candidatus Eremiobacteraeota bacterium]|nr:RES family NAD+ phosphorylase [Candidatus Eremiobacteraeota bacterium]